MGAAAIGFIVGMVLGAGLSGEAGAFAGAAVGMLVGASLHALRWLWAHSGDAPTVEHHRVYCTPYGRAADLELVGDLDRHRWLDVKGCSLLEPRTQVWCDKRCLRVIRDAGIEPGQPCHCEDVDVSAERLRRDHAAA